jgi:hypothetical protein
MRRINVYVFIKSANQLGKRVVVREPMGMGEVLRLPPPSHSITGLWADKYLMITVGPLYSPPRFFIHVQSLSQEKE